MSFSEKYASLFNRLLPAPFTIAVLLTALTFILAFLFTGGLEKGPSYSLDLIGYWEKGLWDRGLLVFAFQMMLMLILGHVLALTKPVEQIIEATLKYCTNTAKAAFVVTLLTVLVALFNWGLGLIFGAIFARKVAEYAHKHESKLNYPLIGAAGYSGLMVWHGGISGSSLVKVAEENHLKEMMSGIYNEQAIAGLPTAISFDQTVFGNMNLMVTLILVVVLPLSMYYMGKVIKPKPYKIQLKQWHNHSVDADIKGAEKLNHSRVLTILFSLFILVAIVLRILSSDNLWSFSFMTPDFINLSLLFLCIYLHGSFQKFISAVDEAILGAAGILIQFPLYFGIREKEFIEAGVVLGLSNFRIIWRHILPNIISPVIVISAANFATAILLEAGLSFLGIGAPPPQATWGKMISEHKGYLITGDAFLAIVPGIAIMLLVLAFTFIGNGLRDALDERLVKKT